MSWLRTGRPRVFTIGSSSRPRMRHYLRTRDPAQFFSDKANVSEQLGHPRPVD